MAKYRLTGSHCRSTNWVITTARRTKRFDRTFKEFKLNVMLKQSYPFNLSLFKQFFVYTEFGLSVVYLLQDAPTSAKHLLSSLSTQ